MGHQLPYLGVFSQSCCHRSSEAPNLTLSSGCSEMSNSFYFLQAECAAKLCKLKQQMHCCVFHFLLKSKQFCFSYERLINRKLWLACLLSAKVRAAWKSRFSPGVLITGTSSRGDGKRHLEHLNWKSPWPLCTGTLESLWPSEVLAQSYVAGLGAPWCAWGKSIPVLPILKICFLDLFFSPPPYPPQFSALHKTHTSWG